MSGSLSVASQKFSLAEFQELWPADRRQALQGLFLYGTGAPASGRAGNLTHAADPGQQIIPLAEGIELQIGALYSGPRPALRPHAPDWHISLWNIRHWRLGFILQIEICRDYKIIHDPEGHIATRLDQIARQILPHFVAYLPRI